MRENINRKILARFDNAVDELDLPPRSDMFLADVQPIDAMKCNILIGYDGHSAGPPQLSHIERFVAAKWGGAVVAQSTTARDHEGSEAVSILVTAYTHTRSLQDANTMRKVLAGGYIDDNTGHIWVVADDGDKKFLYRRPDRSVTEIVGEAVRHSRKQACFSTLRTAAPIVTVGDRVRFFDGSLPLTGKVSSVSDDKVSISVGGKSHSVAPEAVFNVLERSESRLSGDRNALDEYFARAFGNEEFSRKLTRKLNREENPLSGDTGWSGTVGNEPAGKD